MRPLLAPLLALPLSLMGCAPAAPTDLAGPSAAVGCSAGATRLAPDGCNTCTCDLDGAWACSALACAAPCAPGEVAALPGGCETCTCSADGAWTCSTTGCPEPPVEPNLGACAAGDHRPGDCGGICWCAAGAWACDLDCDGLHLPPEDAGGHDGAGGEGEGAGGDGGEGAGGRGPGAGGDLGQGGAACSADADCAPSGCGGRVCAPAEAPASCAEDAPPAACYVGPQAVTRCGCEAGRCAWAAPAALAACAAAEAEAPEDPEEPEEPEEPEAPAEDPAEDP